MFSIDTHVYSESVEKAREKYPINSEQIQKLLESNAISIIPVDISNVLPLFHDPGESSCFILSQRGSITITNDLTAIKKFNQNGHDVIQLPDIYYYLYQNHKISLTYYDEALKKLSAIGAISPKIHLFYYQKITRGKKNE